jgi:protocatechuate 3,4-dioxygenase beta subunit
MLPLTSIGVEGELIRKNVIEKEKGVVMHLDIQVVDINTCTPIPKAAVEIWSANATGVYSGIVGFGNGNRLDTSNQNNKALRGIQITDKAGAVQFETIVPGAYMGRTAHIHSRPALPARHPPR